MVATIKHKSASLTLRPTPEGTVWVANLFSKERMQGHATELMQKLIEKADADGITLQLDARAYGDTRGLTTGALILFYEKFGFYHVVQPGKHLMERKPRSQE